MESTRIFLFIALVAVSYFLWNTWEVEHPVNHPTQTTISPTTVTEQVNETVALSNHLPSTPGKAKLIKVKTDVLDLTINTQKGDIVEASLIKYPRELKSAEPFVLLTDDPNAIYIAQSGLVGTPGQVPNHYESAQTDYKLAQGQNALVVKLFWHNAKGLEIVKTYTFARNSYVVAVGYEINNHSPQTWQGQSYIQLQKRSLPEKKQMFQFATFTGAAISTANKPYEKITYKKLAEQNLARHTTGGWLAFQQHYFLSAWIPAQDEQNSFYSKTQADVYTLGSLSPNITINPMSERQLTTKLYMGPEDAETLKTIAPGLDLTIDYGWLWFISSFLFWLMKHIYTLVGNWGWSIVIITLLIKLAFFKLSATSYRSMARMRELQPKIEMLKEMYGEDRQKMSQEMMKLYREQKVNPFGGCLPILVQIPFFIALYYVLIESVELRQAPFILWIHDLSAADPFYVLPILMGISMFVQQRLSPAPPDPIQAKVMMALPIVFTFLFLNFPAGLVLYWVVNNSLSILQQWYITRKLQLAPKAVVPKKR
jgi:YidC/Oxa1 family membrane protein insertase